MIKYLEKCSSCNCEIIEEDLPRFQGDEILIYNIYYKRKLIKTYCSEECLKKDFFVKIINRKKKFIFIPYTEKKKIWISKKCPKQRYKVVGFEV
jgi:hypothetical protein